MKAPLCHVADIPTDGAKKIEFFGREVLVYQTDGQPRAVFNACMHLGGPLERNGDAFVCPWHGATFDCASGMRTRGPGGTHDTLLVLPTQVESGVLTYVYGE